MIFLQHKEQSNLKTYNSTNEQRYLPFYRKFKEESRCVLNEEFGTNLMPFVEEVCSFPSLFCETD